MPLTPENLEALKSQYQAWCQVNTSFEGRESDVLRSYQFSKEKQQQSNKMYRDLRALLKNSGFNLKQLPLNSTLGRVRLIEALSHITPDEIPNAETLAQDRALTNALCMVRHCGSALTLTQLLDKPSEVMSVLDLTR